MGKDVGCGMRGAKTSTKTKTSDVKLATINNTILSFQAEHSDVFYLYIFYLAHEIASHLKISVLDFCLITGHRNMTCANIGCTSVDLNPPN